MKQADKKVVIRSIKRAAGRNGLPGNFIINGDLWINSREIRNNLISAGLPADVSPIALIGASINYKELTIEEADVANGNSVKHTINGREVEFKKPGVNNVEAELDFATVNIDETFLNLCKTGAMATERRLATTRTAPVRRTAPAVATDTETLVITPENQPATPVDTPVEEGVEHEDLAS